MSVPDVTVLQKSPRPAWLWDPARRRVVWANPAGVAFFGEDSLFDLVERPFDAREPAVAAIADAASALEKGQTVRVELEFPSAASDAPLDAELHRHLLADGRPGVLIAAREALPPKRTGHAGLMREVLEAMPLAVVVVDAAGALVYANAAAGELFVEDSLAGLSGLFDEAGEANAFLERTSRAGMAAATRTGNTKLGLRDIRITARHVPAEEGGDDLFILLLEDVTDRRALEEAAGRTGFPAPPQAETGPPPEKLQPEAGDNAKTLPLSDDDIRAFRRLSESPGPQEKEAEKTAAGEGKSAGKEQTAATAHAAATETRPAEKQPRATAGKPTHADKTQDVPPLVRDVLDHRSEAIVLHRDCVFYFANSAAREIFGHGADEEAWNNLAARLAEAADGAVLRLPDSAGAEHAFLLKRDVFPWRDGAVIQSTLLPRGGNGDEEATPPAGETARSGGSSDAGGPLQPAPAQKSAPVTRIAGMAPPQEGRNAGGGEAAGETRPEPKASAPASPCAEPMDEELRYILDTATDGIITLNTQGLILSFSAGAEALFGLSVSDVVGKPFIDLLDGDSRRTVRDYLSALASDKSLAGIYNEGREVTARIRGGGRIPLFLTIGRLGRRGEPERENKAAYCVVVRDITQWKKTETELRQAKEKAERSSAQKSEFLASISHELRTPLNAILGFSEVMRQQRFGEMGNEKYLGYANDIHESGEHLLSLINDLLDLSKIEAGKFELDFTAVDLGSVVEECLNLMQEEAAKARVILRRSVPANLPKVVADARSMKQIFLNLLSNAVKFTEPGGQVMVSLKINDAGELTARVRDTGIGMSGQELQRALKPFERITREGAEKPGTGLGLPLTKALVEANRARFSIKSEPGKGTTATITFPTPRVLAG